MVDDDSCYGNSWMVQSMTHKDITRRIDQDFNDLKVRNPEKYRELEGKYRRLQDEANTAVALSPVPAHVRRAERLS